MEIQRKYGVEYHKYWVNESWQQSFLPRTCAKRRGGRVCASRSSRDDGRENYRGGTRRRRSDSSAASETNPAGAVLLPGSGADDRDPGIRTILFTDVVNSTTLTQLLGDEAALALLGVHDTIVRDALSALGGREIKHTGDGIMASFVSTAGAVRCAIQIQRELDKHAQANPEHPLKVRVGAAAGEPVEQHNDLFGCTVQLAARLCAHAQPEQILRFERNRRAVHRQRAFVRGRRRSDPQRLRFPSPRPRRRVATVIPVYIESTDEH